MPALCLLGPQRLRPTLGPALTSLGVEGPLALVSAGWQERESEVVDLRDHVHRDVLNLRLYVRYERVLRADPELADALAERQRRLRDLQRFYRKRLDHALAAARELDGPSSNEAHHFHASAAVRAVRALDRQHVATLRAAHAEFEERWRPGERDEVARHRREIERCLTRCGALAVAGGHVAVLLTRMRLLLPARALSETPVVAWSAGAMALGGRIVLFHDHPPQGAGNAEVLDVGLGVYRGLVPLPHARRRLRLADARRVSLFARRFAPDLCIAFDDGGRVDRDGNRWHAGGGVRRLTSGGDVREFGT